MKLNSKYLTLLLLIFLIEIIIAIFLNDNIIRPYIGDVLVVVLIYCFIRTFIKKEIKLLPLYVFIFAAIVEVLQLFNILSILNFKNISVLKIIIGSTFDWADMLCYFVGALCSALIQWIDKKNGRIIIPLLIAASLVSASVLMILAYNGLWWPVNPSLMGFEIKGIDVARYQGDIDWKVISEQDIKFAFIKATEGSSYVDPYFEKNIVESKKNGIANGAYHFFSTESSGKTQAENFIMTTSLFEVDMPTVVDFEIEAGRYNDKEKIIEELKVFLHELADHTGIKPIIYTTYESYDAYLLNGFGDYAFWFRDLLKKPSFGGNLIFWQYCNRGRLYGIDKTQRYVDLNVFVGSKQEFIEFLGK